eukprot:272159-Chlamydomonas_euryale.AAC.1
MRYLIASPLALFTDEPPTGVGTGARGAAPGSVSAGGSGIQELVSNAGLCPYPRAPAHLTLLLRPPHASSSAVSLSLWHPETCLSCQA